MLDSLAPRIGNHLHPIIPPPYVPVKTTCDTPPPCYHFGRLIEFRPSAQTNGSWSMDNSTSRVAQPHLKRVNTSVLEGKGRFAEFWVQQSDGIVFARCCSARTP